MLDSKRRVSGAYATFLAIYGICLSAYYLVFAEFAKTNLLVSVVFALLIPLVWLIYPLENIMQRILPIFMRIGMAEEKQLVGKWLINIEYEDTDKTVQGRSGALEIRLTMFGLNIEGGMLVNNNAAEKDKTMESWRADNVYLYDTSAGLIMTYIYKTNEGEEGKSDKVGVVSVTVKKKLNPNKPIIALGVFNDSPIHDEARSGYVRLTKQ